MAKPARRITTACLSATDIKEQPAIAALDAVSLLLLPVLLIALGYGGRVSFCSDKSAKTAILARIALSPQTYANILC